MRLSSSPPNSASEFYSINEAKSGDKNSILCLVNKYLNFSFLNYSRTNVSTSDVNHAFDSTTFYESDYMSTLS